MIEIKTAYPYIHILTMGLPHCQSESWGQDDLIFFFFLFFLHYWTEMIGSFVTACHRYMCLAALYKPLCVDQRITAVVARLC